LHDDPAEGRHRHGDLRGRRGPRGAAARVHQRRAYEVAGHRLRVRRPRQPDEGDRPRRRHHRLRVRQAGPPDRGHGPRRRPHRDAVRQLRQRGRDHRPAQAVPGHHLRRRRPSDHPARGQRNRAQARGMDVRHPRQGPAHGRDPL
ncbi:hypothetical protein ALMP_77240, partial [Streptomyces sp. A012304]